VLLSALVATGLITGSGLTMDTARLLGRYDAATGAIQLVQIGANLTLSSSGFLSASIGGGIADIRDIWLFS
jgi:hypothetical protein